MHQSFLGRTRHTLDYGSHESAELLELDDGDSDLDSESELGSRRFRRSPVSRDQYGNSLNAATA